MSIGLKVSDQKENWLKKCLVKKNVVQKITVQKNVGSIKVWGPKHHGYKNSWQNDLTLNKSSQTFFWNLPLKFGQN